MRLAKSRIWVWQLVRWARTPWAASTSRSCGQPGCFSLANFDRTFAINVRSVFVATQAAVTHMKAGGRIVNIGSWNAERVPFVGGAAYATSKSAFHGL